MGVTDGARPHTEYAAMKKILATGGRWDMLGWPPEQQDFFCRRVGMRAGIR